MNTVYLCGAINGCTDAECKDWRQAVKEAMGNGPHERLTAVCVDPMRRDYRGKEHDNYRAIVEYDKIDVRFSDVILVNYVKPSVGTAMEMFYAWTLGKPVILWCAEDTVLSPWLIYHATEIVHSLDDAISKIREALR